MRLALGKMNIAPDVFWGMSFPDFYRRMCGFAVFHSGGKPPPLSKGELEDLMERYPD